MQERAAALVQVRQRRPEAVDHPEEVDVEHAPELLGLELVGLAHHRDHRVRDVRVDPPEPVERLLDDLADLVLDGVVGRDGERLGAERLDLPGSASSASRVPRRDDDLRARRAGAARDRPAEAAGGAGDDDDLLGERLLGAPRFRIPARGRLETGYPEFHAGLDRISGVAHPAARRPAGLRPEATAGDGQAARAGHARVQGLGHGQGRPRTRLRAELPAPPPEVATPATAREQDTTSTTTP